MTDEYSSSRESDEDILEAQSGSRKRRKMSAEEDSDSDTESAPRTSAMPAIARVNLGKGHEGIQPTSRTQKPTPDAVQKGLKEKTDFASINVAPWLVSSLSSMEIKRPTGIQKACIPEILKGRDCIGGSRTGTGKTVAFSVPIMQKWAEDPCGIFALIIT
jgi:ATP-dependent RNA helicase DDX49/DBP8|tara:strand:+ start:7549 stop:8028 length:480 start_codon:yes stop_codon:yes gene_type:complete